MPFILTASALVLLTIGFYLRGHLQRQARENHIRHFRFPRGIYAKVIERHPQLSLRDMELVGQGLRQFFLAYLKSGEQYVSMPSQVADDLWHEFILYTKNYQEFNRRAFKKFLHHTPAAVVSDNKKANTGLRRCWNVLCKEENINPRKPNRLPLLFALDAKFSIVNGFRYAPDCTGFKKPESEDGDMSVVIYCGSDLATGTGGSSGDWDGGDIGSALSNDSGGSSDSGGDSAGGDSSCGGGGCGGGCGGGD